MFYTDLQPVLQAYSRGDNVTEFLRRQMGSVVNTPEIIEVAYDLQSGTYVDWVKQNEATWRVRTEEMAAILLPHLKGCVSVLEAGTGELTTLTGIAAAVYPCTVQSYACDISWSRIKTGLAFAGERLRAEHRAQLTAFVGDMFRLPFRDRAIDVVWTCHAVEPNGGREREIVRELMRVARKTLVLFEPSYELGSEDAKARMQRLGYVRGLPEAIAAEGGDVIQRIAVEHVANPLNPTVALVVRPRRSDAAGEGLWACPATGLPMEQAGDCYFSERSLLAYPVLGGIPVLRKEAAILAASMR